MNLIISADLSTDPPSEGLYFRFLTMMAQKELDYCVVIESQGEMVDLYYKFLKKRGWFDFIDDIVLPEWEIEGVRIDTQLDFPKTIQVKYIRCENTPNLIGQIKSLRKINL
tara:strand:- start:2123 stop:2455 length:333 start_codon:yes stop_codon:yes gene_type:complete